MDPALALGLIGIRFRNRIQFLGWTYTMSKKSWPILYSNLLYKIGQDLLDIQYPGSWFNHAVDPEPKHKTKFKNIK